MKREAVFILFIYIVLTGFRNGENPQTEISNGIIKASLYLPNTNNGYYRATRFDWAGIISSLEYNGHTYFGKWFEEYSPTAHYSTMGPVDSFDPLKYNETKPGESFVKIGVGSLTKPDGNPFNAFTTYPVIDPGMWKIKMEATKIQFQHILNHTDYPYEYTKIIEFVEGKPEMRISYRLKNKGKQRIETHVFNHNFFVFDHQLVGKGFELTFPKNIVCPDNGRGIGDIAEVNGNKLKIMRSLAKGESVYCGSLEGINNNPDGYDIQIDCYKTGAGVRMKGSQPISKLVFWCNDKTICPEPYINIAIEPGKEFSWETTYEFYITDETDK